ncbi:RNA methyltransferase [Prescottella equi]|uniref:RNA methyltransferase n=1 Tax=Rhodococcus hoagii TaxID=43767 RepID=UPI003D98A162
MSGYFGVAVWHPKFEVNVGTLWRSAMTYDAAFLATIGRRYEPQASDTCKAPLSLPLHHYADIDDLITHLPKSCPVVGVELSERAIPLTEFAHPVRALYLLGAEDHGLPAAVLERCHHVVQIPTPAAWSLNVSVAGSLVMHDRVVTKRTAVLP